MWQQALPSGIRHALAFDLSNSVVHRGRATPAAHRRRVCFASATAGAAFPANPVWTAFEDGVQPNARTGGPSGGASSLGSLATYALPSPRRRQRWLDETIRSAVLNIEQAPFLQATSTDPKPQLRRFHVAPEVGSAPQMWTSIVRHLTGQDTDSVLYVSPIALGDTDEPVPAGMSCLSADACSTAREILSGVVTGESQAILSGRVGDCCDSQHPHSHSSHQGSDFKHSYAKASQILPYKPLRREREAPAERTVAVPIDRPLEGRVRAGSMIRGQLQQLYGVVIQSQGLDGCFVLKTMKHEEADCQCTSYSLAKICDGIPT